MGNGNGGNGKDKETEERGDKGKDSSLIWGVATKRRPDAQMNLSGHVLGCLFAFSLYLIIF